MLATKTVAHDGDIARNPVSTDGGPLVYEGSNTRGRIRLYLVAGDAVGQELLAAEQTESDFTSAAVSSYREWTVFVARSAVTTDLYLRSTQTGEVTRLTSGSEDDDSPVFSPDGERVLLERGRAGARDIYEVVRTSGFETLVTGGPGDQFAPAYGANGVVVFLERVGAEEADLMATSAGIRTVLATGVRVPARMGPAVSPDGRWIAYTRRESADVVNLVTSDGRETVHVPADGCADPALGAQGDRSLPACGTRTRSALPIIVDVTEALRRR